MRMSGKILLAAVAVAALSGTAMAADLPSPSAPPEVVPVAPAPTSWDGAYIGANFGYSWADSDVSSTDPVFDDSYDDGGYTSTSSPTGWEVGGQIGYLFHLSDNVVGGIEGSLDWANATDEANTYY